MWSLSSTQLQFIIDLIGYKPHHSWLYLESLTHKSYAKEQSKAVAHNQRLEFLGDSVLGLVIAGALYQDHPDYDEAQLTLFKISLVREECLYQVAKHIHLDRIIVIWIGEEKKWWRDNPAILGDGLEALIGYIYLDFWFDVARKFVLDYVYSQKSKIELVGSKSRKSLLQEHIQWLYKVLPVYIDTEHERDDARNYIIYKSTVMLDNQILAVGYGTNKKKAQEDAAKQAMETRLDVVW